MLMQILYKQQIVNQAFTKNLINKEQLKQLNSNQISMNT